MSSLLHSGARGYSLASTHVFSYLKPQPQRDNNAGGALRTHVEVGTSFHFLVSEISALGKSSKSLGTFITDYLRHDRLRKCCNVSEFKIAYLESLAALCEKEGNELAVTQSQYKIGNRIVELFDIKPRSRFEDDVMERIATEWKNVNPHLGPVCPLRRGICVGTIDNGLALVLCVGNVKFFNGSLEEILATRKTTTNGKLLVSEKANGEYTLSSMVKISEDEKWIVVGSKNVRVCLPFDPAQPQKTMKIFQEEFLPQIASQSPELNDNRFSYVHGMLGLWMQALEDSNLNSSAFAAALENGSIVGEQVGVHAHIYDEYTRPQIRVFAYVPFSELTTRASVPLDALAGKFFGDKKFAATICAVDFQVFPLPDTAGTARKKLLEIQRGQMEVFGEGAVVYVLDGSGAVESVYKFKCEEYYFDRRLRTLLTPLVAELSKLGMSHQRLAGECRRVTLEMEKAKTQFASVDPARAQRRIELIPAMVCFLNIHQATSYCREFSDWFTQTIGAVEKRLALYERLAKATFQKAELENHVDIALEKWTALVETGAAINASLFSVEEIANEICNGLKRAGGVDAFKLLGLAVGPGGGKTTVLSKLVEMIPLHFPGKRAVLFDRDKYVISMGSNARADLVHREWMKDICNTIKSDVNALCLIGNTFTGAFSDKLENMVYEASEIRCKVFLVTFAEHLLPVSGKRLVPTSKQFNHGDNAARAKAALFHLHCLKRLLNRKEVNADDSTLTLSSGPRVVLEKYFSSQLDDNMFKNKQRNGSVLVLPAVRDVALSEDGEKLIAIAKGLVDLKHLLQALDKAEQQEVKKLKQENKSNASHDRLAVQRTSHLLRVGLNRISPTSRVTYFAVFPSPECEAMLCEMVDEMASEMANEIDRVLVRTDMHATVRFKPTEGEIEAMIKTSNAFVEFDLLGVCLARVGEGGQENFLLFAIAGENELDVPHLHITLACSDFDAVPPSSSFSLLERTDVKQCVERKAATLDLEDDKKRSVNLKFRFFETPRKVRGEVKAVMSPI